MSEKTKMTIEEIQKKLGDLTEFTEITKADLEAMIKRRPLESAGVVFLAGIVVGILIGASMARRS